MRFSLASLLLVSLAVVSAQQSCDKSPPAQPQPSVDVDGATGVMAVCFNNGQDATRFEATAIFGTPESPCKFAGNWDYRNNNQSLCAHHLLSTLFELCPNAVRSSTDPSSGSAVVEVDAHELLFLKCEPDPRPTGIIASTFFAFFDMFSHAGSSVYSQMSVDINATVWVRLQANLRLFLIAGGSTTEIRNGDVVPMGSSLYVAPSLLCDASCNTLLSVKTDTAFLAESADGLTKPQPIIENGVCVGLGCQRVGQSQLTFTMHLPQLISKLYVFVTLLISPKNAPSAAALKVPIRLMVEKKGAAPVQLLAGESNSFEPRLWSLPPTLITLKDTQPPSPTDDPTAPSDAPTPASGTADDQSTSKTDGALASFSVSIGLIGLLTALATMLIAL